MLDLNFLAAAAGEHAAAAEHAPAGAFGIPALNATFFIALAMLVVFGIMLKAGVPKLIAGMLDAKIAEIKHQLDQAAALRQEAEALKAQYAAKMAGAEADAAAVVEHAKAEAEAIVARAEVQTKETIARREKLAKDKIAAAERAAIDELRATAVAAAAAAAGTLIAENHDAKADKALVDEAIAAL